MKSGFLVGACVFFLVCAFFCGCASNVPGKKYVARYERALRLFDQKKYEETLTELKPVIVHFPIWPDGALLYARAARATETIENRRQASKILVRLLSNYPERSDVRHELASLYFEQGFLGYSRSQYETLLRANDRDTRSHYMMGLILQKDWKRYRSEKDLSRMIAELVSSIATDTSAVPDSLKKDVLSRLAIAYLEKNKPDSMQVVINRMMSSFPTDVDAIMLGAIAHHEKGEYKKALEDWKKFFSLCDSTTADAFSDLTLLITPRQRTKLKHMGKAAREEFTRRFWMELDPTPTTPVNERMLEHWRRVGLSKMLFTVAATGTPGWRTGPGEALIRYGFPKSRQYGFSLDESRNLSIPTLTWQYEDEGGTFEVAFVDYGLNGEFEYFEFSQFPTQFDRRAYYSPTSYEHNYNAKVFQNLFASAGFLKDKRVREELYVGVPMDRVSKGDWRRVQFEAVVFDSSWHETARTVTTLKDAVTYAEPGVGGFLIRELDFGLAPGKYTVAVAVTDTVSGTLGLTKQSIEVPYLLSRNLCVSDIELAYRLPEARISLRAGKEGGVLPSEVLPNPSGTYFMPATLKLYYEVYNLAQDRDGEYRFATRYSILPSRGTGSSFWGLLASLFSTSPQYIVSSFERQVENPSSPERLAIDVSALKDGSYNLILDIEDTVSKKHAQVVREFEKITPP